MNIYKIHKIEVSKTFGNINNWSSDSNHCYNWLVPLPSEYKYLSSLCSPLVRDKLDAFVSLAIL